MGTRLLLAVLTTGALLAPSAAADAGGASLVHSYEVRGRGNATDLVTFSIAVAGTLADPRGWSLGGDVRFDQVRRGGELTVWLAADDQTASFGAACAARPVCVVGDDVVVNEGRWRAGGPAWRKAGGSRGEYRRMLVNHGVGRWLGLRPATCTVPGRAAPVTLEPPGALDGCFPNPWPVAAERAAADARRAELLRRERRAPFCRAVAARGRAAPCL